MTSWEPVSFTRRTLLHGVSTCTMSVCAVSQTVLSETRVCHVLPLSDQIIFCLFCCIFFIRCIFSVPVNYVPLIFCHNAWRIFILVMWHWYCFWGYFAKKNCRRVCLYRVIKERWTQFVSLYALNSKRRLNTRQTVGCGIPSSLLALRVDLRGLRSKLSWIRLTFSSDTRGRPELLPLHRQPVCSNWWFLRQMLFLVGG